jgi:hypothetical protein
MVNLEFEFPLKTGEEKKDVEQKIFSQKELFCFIERIAKTWGSIS